MDFHSDIRITLPSRSMFHCDICSKLQKFKVFFSAHFGRPTDNLMSGTPHRSKNPTKLCGETSLLKSDDTFDLILHDMTT